MKVTELVAHWRAEAAESTSDPAAHYQLLQCADQLESAIEAAVLEAAQALCNCGHALVGHGTAGCLAPAPLGSHRTFCECRRQVTH